MERNVTKMTEIIMMMTKMAKTMEVMVTARITKMMNDDEDDEDDGNNNGDEHQEYHNTVPAGSISVGVESSMGNKELQIGRDVRPRACKRVREADVTCGENISSVKRFRVL